MNNTQYCMDCGSPAPLKANFCPSCRFPFNAQAKAKLANEKVRQTVVKEESDEIVEDPEESTEDLDNLIEVSKGSQLEIEFLQPRHVKNPLGNLIDSGKPSIEIARKTNTTKVNKKEFLREFQKEAGSLRKK